MKRATGLIFILLALAVVAHGDTFVKPTGEFMKGDAIGAPAPFPQALQASYEVGGPELTPLSTSRSFSGSGDLAALADDSEFGKLANPPVRVGDPASFGFLPLSSNGLTEEPRREPSRFFGVDPAGSFFDSASAQTVPEPGTLAMLCAGLVALAMLRRRGSPTRQA